MPSIRINSLGSQQPELTFSPYAHPASAKKPIGIVPSFANELDRRLKKLDSFRAKEDRSIGTGGDLADTDFRPH